MRVAFGGTIYFGCREPHLPLEYGYAKALLQRKAREMEKKRDDAWRAYDEAAKQIEVEKDSLLDRVEEQLAQSATTQDLFCADMFDNAR